MQLAENSNDICCFLLGGDFYNKPNIQVTIIPIGLNNLDKSNIPFTLPSRMVRKNR